MPRIQNDCINTIEIKKSKFITYLHRTQDEQEAKDFLKDLPDCKISQWNPCAYDVIPKQGGKTAGIESVLKHYGIKQEEIMAFGDAENDIEMLQYAKIGVAMGNADDEVKEAADYVTDTVDSDGIYKALKYYEVLK